MFKPTSLSFAQRQELITRLTKDAQSADAIYDRAARHMGNNEEECGKLYHASQAAWDEVAKAKVL